MSATQFFPISPEMSALACETISRRVSRLPFLRSGVMVTGELIGVAMECLNAEFNKTLALRALPDTAGDRTEGLDRCIGQRLNIPGTTVVPVIADVLCSAGIAEPAEILDRRSRRSRKGIRLLPPWTWHAASETGHPVQLHGSGTGDAASPSSWMSMCPVCRTGILNRVFGKQLFGIPRTDFYIECTYCGAKFIPVGPAYRLVSIATIRDPLWKKHLNRTFPAETWSALARGTGPDRNLPAPQKTHPGPYLQTPVGGLTRSKDGSLAVPCEGKTLYFRPLALHFAGGTKGDVFARARRPLRDILENPVFGHLKSMVNAKYSRYLPLRVGLFLGQLKERHDPFYREFLNPYGDEKYGTFRLREPDEAGTKGVLMVVANTGVYHAASCPDTIRGIVNDTFGRIAPEDCYLTGDPVRCRVNALLSNNKKEAGLYSYSCEKEKDRARITETLKRYITAGSA